MYIVYFIPQILFAIYTHVASALGTKLFIELSLGHVGRKRQELKDKREKAHERV